jgi:surface carbohydrate biosynthesis protein (TIGR04326 family)
LIHAWQKHRHGDLRGVVHSTLNFWDLRHFWDERTTSSPAAHGLPRPDGVIVNGVAAMRVYDEAGGSRKAVTECEALRYTYLGGMRSTPLRRADEQPPRLLILGDANPKLTHQLLGMLDQLDESTRATYEYVIKVHPDLPVRSEDYPNLSLTVVSDPLRDLLPGFTAAYAGATTSAAVDAYLVGLPVIVLRDAGGLNLTPLRKQPDVSVVSTPGELALALAAARDARPSATAREFFLLDGELRRWEHLLAS